MTFQFFYLSYLNTIKNSYYQAQGNSTDMLLMQTETSSVSLTATFVYPYPFLHDAPSGEIVVSS